MVQIERNQGKENMAVWHLGYFLAKKNISVQYKSLYSVVIANSRQCYSIINNSMVDHLNPPIYTCPYHVIKVRYITLTCSQNLSHKSNYNPVRNVFVVIHHLITYM